MHGENEVTEITHLLNSSFCPFSLQLPSLLFQALPYAWLLFSHPKTHTQLYLFSVKRFGLIALPVLSQQPHYCCHADEALVQNHQQEYSAFSSKDTY